MNMWNIYIYILSLLMPIAAIHDVSTVRSFGITIDMMNITDVLSRAAQVQRDGLSSLVGTGGLLRWVRGGFGTTRSRLLYYENTTRNRAFAEKTRLILTKVE